MAMSGEFIPTCEFIVSRQSEIPTRHKWDSLEFNPRVEHQMEYFAALSIEVRTDSRSSGVHSFFFSISPTLT
jgi:hypothetical protein